MILPRAKKIVEPEDFNVAMETLLDENVSNVELITRQRDEIQNLKSYIVDEITILRRKVKAMELCSHVHKKVKK